jgi:hypothetical protein
VPWQNFVTLPDVVLAARDPQVTAIDLAAATPIQVARGSVVTDDDGARQATLLFAEGTQAELRFADGSAQAISQLSIRATEYTVGPMGRAAMPAELPPASGYTYAVELGADEVDAAGAVSVAFDPPVTFYLENFIGFPVGGQVPVGSYDRQAAAWIASDDGRVLEIVGVNGGVADLDTDGDGGADDPGTLAVLGITLAVREQLGGLYPVGQRLWRVPVPHFSPWDCNWPYGPPADAAAPDGSPPREGAGQPEDDPSQVCGSIIGVENQTLGESVAVTGTPFQLVYQSDRVPGRTAANTLTVSLSGATLPPGVKDIQLEVEIAGQHSIQSFAVLPDQDVAFTWDGRDAYGRTVSGSQPARVRVGYTYDAVYQQPGVQQQSFGAFSGVPVTTDQVRAEITLWQEHRPGVVSPGARSPGVLI